MSELLSIWPRLLQCWSYSASGQGSFSVGVTQHLAKAPSVSELLSIWPRLLQCWSYSVSGQGSFSVGVTQYLAKAPSVLELLSIWPRLLQCRSYSVSSKASHNNCMSCIRTRLGVSSKTVLLVTVSWVYFTNNHTGSLQKYQNIALRYTRRVE